MPRYYSYGAQPRHYGGSGEIERMYTARAATTRELGGSLGSYFGGQNKDLGASNFGGQNKDLGAALLSNNEKTLLAVGVLGLVGWFMFGDKIKKGFKKNPAWATAKPAPNRGKRAKFNAIKRRVKKFRDLDDLQYELKKLNEIKASSVTLNEDIKREKKKLKQRIQRIKRVHAQRLNPR